MRTREEIENKIEEMYRLLNENKIDILKVIISTDALSWVLGEDYLETNVLVGDEKNGNNY